MLTKDLIEMRKKSAIEMVGKKMESSTECKAISVDVDKKEATFVMSTVNVDRHGDVIDQASWITKYFDDAPMFFLQHASDAFPIGKWVKRWMEADPENPGEQRMVGTAQFRTQFEDAARAFVHVQEGDMVAVSVGFIPHRVDYDENRDAFVLYDCELLECSLVGVGSNRQALIKSKEDVLDIAMEAKTALEKDIAAYEDGRTISKLKALGHFEKAIRQLKIK